MILPDVGRRTAFTLATAAGGALVSTVIGILSPGRCHSRPGDWLSTLLSQADFLQAR
jgi:hypothetical protein